MIKVTIFHTSIKGFSVTLTGTELLRYSKGFTVLYGLNLNEEQAKHIAMLGFGFENYTQELQSFQINSETSFKVLSS